MQFPQVSRGMQCGNLALPAGSCWESLSQSCEFSSLSQGLCANWLPPPRTCLWPVQHPAWKKVCGSGPGCPHACTPCSWWMGQAGVQSWCCGQEPRSRRDSVTQGGCAKERLVLVCKSRVVFFRAVFASSSEAKPAGIAHATGEREGREVE